MLTDEVSGENINKYMLTSIKNEEVLINIQIVHGEIEVFITNFLGT